MPMDILAELGKLHELHRSGALTDAEFAKAKAAILGAEPMGSVDSPPADEIESAADNASRKLGPPFPSSDPAPPSPPLARDLGRVAGRLKREFRSLPDNTQKIILWTVIALLFGVTFLSAVHLLSGPAKPQTDYAEEIRKIHNDPAFLERTATEELKDFHSAIVKSKFPTKAELVGPLANGGYGKHHFSVLDSKWNLEPNRESLAYPFKGTIEVRYKRWATIYHETELEAEADDKFYFANYDNISWYKDAKVAEQSIRFMPSYRTKVITALFDKAELKWIIKSDEIK